MLNDPLVSVAVCTYNGEKFLKEQLDSILNQSHSNLEVIIVDDCSSDGTVDIIKDYQARFSIINLYQNKVNLGFNKNFEKALSLATGKFIAISDQDDIWAVTKIEKLVGAIDNNWMVFSNSKLIDQSGIELPDNLLADFSLNKKDYRSILLENFVTGHTILMKREILQLCFPIPVESYYDWYLGFISLYHKKLVYHNEPLTYYRVHNESVIQKKNLQDISAKHKEKVDLELVIMRLNAFINYKHLLNADLIFLNKLLIAFEKKKHAFSFSLFHIIFKHYEQLFSSRKPRLWISRLNFAYKYSRKI